MLSRRLAGEALARAWRCGWPVRRAAVGGLPAQEAIQGPGRRPGVIFEDVEVPGLQTIDGVAQVEGNYPSKGGKGELAAWFSDSEGNLFGLGQPLR
jgi:hypothetical protein